jgi:hypothetical protein
LCTHVQHSGASYVRGTTLTPYTFSRRTQDGVVACGDHFGHWAISAFGASAVTRYPSVFGVSDGIDRIGNLCYGGNYSHAVRALLGALVSGRSPAHQRTLAHKVLPAAEMSFAPFCRKLEAGSRRPACFERLLITQGTESFAFVSRDAAADFRRAITNTVFGEWLAKRLSPRWKTIDTSRRSGAVRKAKTLILNRSGEPERRRGISNIEVLHSALRRRGVQFDTDTTSGSFEAGASHFRDYVVIITASGSQLANMVFAKPGTAILEVTPYM